MKLIAYLFKSNLSLLLLMSMVFLPTTAHNVLTEEQVYERIMARKNVVSYAEGAPWDNSHKYVNKSTVNGYSAGCYTGGGCFAFMIDMMEYASNSKYEITFTYGSYDNLPEVHVGDGLRMDNNGHSVVVIKTTPGSHVVTVCESNYNNSVHWGREIDLSNPQNGFTYVASFWPAVNRDKEKAMFSIQDYGK